MIRPNLFLLACALVLFYLAITTGGVQGAIYSVSFLAATYRLMLVERQRQEERAIINGFQELIKNKELQNSK